MSRLRADSTTRLLDRATGAATLETLGHRRLQTICAARCRETVRARMPAISVAISPSGMQHAIAPRTLRLANVLVIGEQGALMTQRMTSEYFERALRPTMLLLLLMMLAGWVGCDNADLESRLEAPPVPVADTPATSHPEANAPSDTAASDDMSSSSVDRAFAGIRFKIPVEWRELPNQQFVDAKFVIPSAQGDMELTMTTMGGGIEKNLSRWSGQVQQAPGDTPHRETITVDGVEATWVDLRGTFASSVGQNAGPRDNWRMIGVAIPQEPRDFYLKLVGPRSAVVEIHDQFREFVRSGSITK